MPSPKELAKALAYRGEIRNTPQNSFLGGVANFLSPVSEFLDRGKLPESIPLLGGMSAADVTGVKGTESLVRDMSYGTPPIRGASLQTAKVDPRVLDLAGVSGAMIPVGKALGKAALREGARQIETGTGVLGRNVMNPKMSAVPEGITSRQVRELIDKNSPGESLDFDALRSAIGGNSYKLTDYDIGKINFGDLSVDASKAMPSKGPIVIGKDGKIIDGRHRAALAKSMGDSHIKAYVPVGDNVGGAMMQRPKTTVPNTRSNYDTKQDGPFYRVTPRSYSEAQGNNRRDSGAIGQSSNPTANTGADRELGNGISERQQGGALASQVVPPPELNKPFQIARQYTKATQGTDFGLPDMPVSSFEKQSGIARVHQLGLEGSPEYKNAIFDAYQRQMPKVVEMSGAKNYDQLMEMAYRQLAKETDEQFKSLPYKFSFHKNGEGDYANSRLMNADLHNNSNLNVYQGGERHDFLNNIDKETGLNENEKFRAVHDVLGHGIYGNQFGPKGEEMAFGIHQQMYSPLARLAMTSETRGQNSLVNYSPLNADVNADIHRLDGLASQAKQAKDYSALKEINAARKDAFSSFQFSPQKALLLPPEFTDLKYAGGIPDYLASVNRPAKSTTFASPLTHYSNKRDLEFADPNRYGTGIKGQEAERLSGAGDISNRSYFYLGEPGQVRPESGLGSNVYRSESANLYNLNKDPLNFTTLAKVSNSTPFNARYNPGVINEGGSLNDIDRLVKLYGYEGLAVPSKSAASMFVPMKLTKPQAIAEALRGRK